MNSQQLEQLKRAARDCACECIDAAGPDPFDHDGDCLLPVEPLEGDWQVFEELTGGCNPDDDEGRVFRDEYSRIMYGAGAGTHKP